MSFILYIIKQIGFSRFLPSQRQLTWLRRGRLGSEIRVPGYKWREGMRMRVLISKYWMINIRYVPFGWPWGFQIDAGEGKGSSWSPSRPHLTSLLQPPCVEDLDSNWSPSFSSLPLVTTAHVPLPPTTNSPSQSKLGPQSLYWLSGVGLSASLLLSLWHLRTRQSFHFPNPYY